MAASAKAVGVKKCDAIEGKKCGPIIRHCLSTIELNRVGPVLGTHRTDQSNDLALT